jgi:hypothetical protein
MSGLRRRSERWCYLLYLQSQNAVFYYQDSLVLWIPMFDSLIQNLKLPWKDFSCQVQANGLVPAVNYNSVFVHDSAV